MDYIFGTCEGVEILKTKGSAHSNFSGFHVVEMKYPDQEITEYFKVIRKLESKEDLEGNYYDWYEIDRHYKTIDKSIPLMSKIEDNKSKLEDLLCEEDTALLNRISLLENAICEMDTTLNREKE